MTEHDSRSRWARGLAAVSRSANTILALALVYLVVMLTITLWQFWPPTRVTPVSALAIEIMTPVTEPGGILPVRMTMDKVRMCDVEDVNLILDDEGFVIARLPPKGRLFPVGVTSRAVVHNLPANIPPGNYSYELMLIYECRWPVGTYLVSPTGDRAFTVRPDPP